MDVRAIPMIFGIELNIELKNTNLRVRSELVGIETGHYLILRFKNFDDGLYSLIPEGSPAIIRYIYRGVVYGFKTTVLKVIAEPSRLVFVEFPEEIEEFSIRKNQRYECVLPGWASAGGHEFEAVIVDLSGEGCRFMISPGPAETILSAAIDEAMTVTIKALLPGMSEPLPLESKVKNLSKVSDRVFCGALFEKLPAETKKTLEGFVHTLSEVEKQ